MSKELIRKLNDSFRNTFDGGSVLMTHTVNALPNQTRGEIVRQIRTFDKFELANDPYEEHDFGSIEVADQKFFWKIDYYDHTVEAASENPADPAVTKRVLTIMRADEY